MSSRIELALLTLTASLAGAAGCKDVNHFSTLPDEAYCGSIVDGAFVRDGFGPGVRMRMTFDADRLYDAPGLLTTDDHLLDDTSLRAIPKLMNDPLSTLSFGEGRDKNLIYAVDPPDASAGPTILAVVSLMHDGNAEVRLLRGSPALDGGASPAVDGSVLFGVFPLQKQKKDSTQCSF